MKQVRPCQHILGIQRSLAPGGASVQL